MDLLAALAEVCRERNVRAGEVRLRGVLDGVSFRELDATSRAFGPTRELAGLVTVAQLDGAIGLRDGAPSIDLQGAWVHVVAGEPKLFGGQLLAGRAYSVEAVIDAFDDVTLERGLDAATGLPRWSAATTPRAPSPPSPIPSASHAAPVAADKPSEPGSRPRPVAAPSRPAFGNAVIHAPEERVTLEPSRPAKPAPSTSPTASAAPSATGSAASGSTSWADVVAAAERNAADPDEPRAVEAAEQLRTGDVIEHSKFGRCEVERIEGDYEFAQVRLRNGRLVRLSLDVIQLVRDGMDGDRRRYRNVVPR